MARETGLSKSSVQRLWSAHAIAPHRLKSFKLSKDLAFEEKFWDVVGLYLNPPDRALLLCCDEKCQCQALERGQPGLPLSQGHIRTQTHDYYRHGTVTLFAALDYLSGKAFAHTAGRHRHQEWLAFRRKIDREASAEFDIHIICSVAPDFTSRIHAGKLIQQIAPIVSGKGGGRPENARGGGSKPAGVDEALAKAKALVSSGKGNPGRSRRGGCPPLVDALE